MSDCTDCVWWRAPEPFAGPNPEKLRPSYGLCRPETFAFAPFWLVGKAQRHAQTYVRPDEGVGCSAKKMFDA